MDLTQESAEEYFSRRMHDAQTLEAAARDFAHPLVASQQNVVAALACAVGADVATLEALVWERVHVAPRDPGRELFKVAQTVTNALNRESPADPEATVKDVVEANRRAIIDTFDDPLTESLAGRWPAIGYLRDVPAPTPAAIIGAAMKRMDSATPADYVATKRAAAQQVHRRAVAERDAELPDDALRSYYEGDRLAVEAYLVESAVSVGDRALFSVIVRSVLVDSALDSLDELSSDMESALAEIRSTIAAALGSADGQRFLAFLAEC